MHRALKICCIVALTGLLLSQLGLLFSQTSLSEPYWVALLALPLLVPFKGLLVDRLYTYKWTGFLALFYFCVGVSELVSNPLLRHYAYFTTLSSMLLFIASIYYAKYLRVNTSNSAP